MSSENQTPVAAPISAQRRTLFRAGFGAAVLGSMALAGARSAKAAPLTDLDILNFALNLEYLEAEFYSYAAFGHGLDPSMTTGRQNPGVTGGVVAGTQRKVMFSSSLIQGYANEIANDEIAHVKFLRSALGSAAVGEPTIDISAAFNAAAQAAGIGSSFDPYVNDLTFLLGAFVFEDVGVTAYHGAAPLISNKGYLAAAAGILGVEAYHASEVRTLLLGMAQSNPSVTGLVQKISDLRAAASGTPTGNAGDDQGIVLAGQPNIVPTDGNSIVFSRTTSQVLNVVYLGGYASGDKGGFYPQGMNGNIH